MSRKAFLTREEWRIIQDRAGYSIEYYNHLHGKFSSLLGLSNPTNRDHLVSEQNDALCHDSIESPRIGREETKFEEPRKNSCNISNEDNSVLDLTQCSAADFESEQNVSEPLAAVEKVKETVQGPLGITANNQVAHTIVCANVSSPLLLDRIRTPVNQALGSPKLSSCDVQTQSTYETQEQGGAQRFRPALWTRSIQKRRKSRQKRGSPSKGQNQFRYFHKQRTPDSWPFISHEGSSSGEENDVFDGFKSTMTSVEDDFEELQEIDIRARKLQFCNTPISRREATRNYRSKGVIDSSSGENETEHDDAVSSELRVESFDWRTCLQGDAVETRQNIDKERKNTGRISGVKPLIERKKIKRKYRQSLASPTSSDEDDLPDSPRDIDSPPIATNSSPRHETKLVRGKQKKTYDESHPEQTKKAPRQYGCIACRSHQCNLPGSRRKAGMMDPVTGRVIIEEEHVPGVLPPPGESLSVVNTKTMQTSEISDWEQQKTKQVKFTRRSVRDQLTEALYHEYNRIVFNGLLPEGKVVQSDNLRHDKTLASDNNSDIVPCFWSKKLQKTAGRATFRTSYLGKDATQSMEEDHIVLVEDSDGGEDGEDVEGSDVPMWSNDAQFGSQQYLASHTATRNNETLGTPRRRVAYIELSHKVCDTPFKLATTLLHEMCHVASWIVDGVSKPPHGRTFWKWGQRASSKYPLRAVTRCHSYDIDNKYHYTCSNISCGIVYKRQSRSIDVKSQVCGVCKSKLVLRNRTGKEITPRKATSYQ